MGKFCPCGTTPSPPNGNANNANQAGGSEAGVTGGAGTGGTGNATATGGTALSGGTGTANGGAAPTSGNRVSCQQIERVEHDLIAFRNWCVANSYSECSIFWSRFCFFNRAASIQ